jgi:serine/threonine-protein kinase RsbW
MDKAGSKKHGKLNGRPSSSIGGVNGESRFEFTIPSDTKAAEDVQEQILADIHRRHYDGHAVFAIKLSLTEAMVNAIRHGNRMDPKKKVHVEATVTPKEVVIVIEDEGPGFDRCGVPNPTLPENLEKCNGRGIHLIESYMNEVEYSHGGRRLRMMKRNEPDVLPRG